jgi:glycosyltransferase involved in cell wall biosynthesis
MIVGVYVANTNKYVGGGYAYQKCLLKSLVEFKSNQATNHSIIFFYRGDNELIKECAGLCVNAEWYRGGLNEAVMRHQIDMMWFLSVACDDIDLPYIMPVWDLQHRLQPFFPEVRSGEEFSNRDCFYNKYLPRATYILTGTEQGKSEIASFYSIPVERIIVNPLPLPHYMSRERKAIPPELAHEGLDRITFVFYPAQFWPHKNHVVLLEAIKKLKVTQNLAIKLVLTGSNYGNAEYIIDKIVEMGLENDVHLLGFVSDEALVWLYQNALALVYPSFFGPDNIPPIEAFFVGCPVIAADVPGAREQLGDAAILVNPRDEDSFVNAIGALLHNPAVRITLIEKGLARVQDKTPEQYVVNILGVIDDFTRVRRCWGTHFALRYTPSLMGWLHSYMENKELHALMTLLQLCKDESLRDLYNELLPSFNSIVSATMEAERAIAARNFTFAHELLSDLLTQCIDYVPIYHNLAKVCLADTDVEKASEYLKTADFYLQRLKLCA